MCDILRVRANAAKQTENGLDEEWGPHQVAVGEVREIVEVGDVIALEFKTRVVAVTGRENELDVLVAVAKDQIARRLEMRLLPVEFEFLVLREQMIQAEVHRSHVQ
jgi:hypothetical protein